MKIKNTKVADLDYIDVEAPVAKVVNGYMDLAIKFIDLSRCKAGDNLYLRPQARLGRVKPEQILITADEAATLKELMEHALAGTQCHLLGRVSENILYNKLVDITAQEQK